MQRILILSYQATCVGQLDKRYSNAGRLL